MLILAAGGLTIKQFGAEIGDAIEVVRRGESEKEVIIPLSEAAKKIKADAEANRATGRRAAPAEDVPRVYTIDTPQPSPKPAAPTTPKPDHGPLPLD